MIRNSLVLVLVLPFASACGRSENGGPASPATPGTPGATTASNPVPAKEPPVKRPPLVRQQGRYFAWAMPQGWRFNETANGVDVYAPDEKAGAGVSVVFNYPGQTTPERVIDRVDELLGITDANVVKEKPLPDVMGYGGLPWKLLERDYKYTFKGLKARRKSTAGVQSYGNGFHAALGYYSCEAKKWDELSTWLVAIVNSIVVTNPRQLANLDKVSLPKNNPMDHDALRGYWKEKGLSEDRIAQGQREGMMGYEEMESRDTGKTFQMPLETYDATKGGYHNPDNFDEILQKPD
ncbi:MAG: hypothetical protein AAB074_04160 [Planctomycetota bacterium]